MMDENAPTERRQGIRLSDLADAQLLLTYAAGSGIKIDPDIADVLDACSRLFGGEEVGVEEGDQPLEVSASSFYGAYQSLSGRLQPVTAQTLRDTAPADGWRMSYAGRWSVWLMVYTSFFLWFIIIEQILGRLMVACYSDEETLCLFVVRESLHMVFQTLVPFAYGGLGACAFLLVSCHHYLVERTFQRIRRHEYWSRLLLGIIAGGTILLFVEQVVHDDGTRINISSAALAFIAGYNVDFLFQTIERLMQAILPKVGLDSVASSGGHRQTYEPEPVALDELLRLHNEAPDEKAREAVARVIDKLTDR